MEKLIETVFKEEFSDKLLNGIQIIIELLRKNHSPSYDSSSTLQSLSSPFFSLLDKYFGTIHKFLTTPPPVSLFFCFFFVMKTNQFYFFSKRVPFR